MYQDLKYEKTCNEYGQIEYTIVIVFSLRSVYYIFTFVDVTCIYAWLI